MSERKKATTRLTLDLSLPNVQKSIAVTQGDSMRELEITVTDAGKPFALPSGYSAILSGTKPDGTKLLNNCVVENGRIIYDFERGDQIATCVGDFVVTVEVIDEDGDTVATPRIWVLVYTSVTREVVNSSDQFGVLVDMANDIAGLQAGQETILEEIYGEDKDPEAPSRIDVVETELTDPNSELNKQLKRFREAGDSLENHLSEYGDWREVVDENLTSLGRITPSFGTLTISKGKWENDTKKTEVEESLPESTLRPGTLVVVVPANDATKKVVAEQGMSIKVDAVTEASNAVTFERLEGKVPEIDLVFRYAVIYTESDEAPTATLVGGLGGGGENGIYIGADYPPPSATIWIDPTGEPSATEGWEFDMEAGGTTVKRVVVLETEIVGGN